ncbi:MAG: c-type cytochrome [Steroidobacteraceae bacterium]
MSKQDSQFFNIFSLVLGILILIAILLFALARVVGKNTQSAHVLTDPKYLAEVESNLTTGRVAVAGRDNSALAIVPAAGAVVAELAIPTDGPGVYEQVCGACHLNGIGGAPKSSDRAAWAPRIAQGKDTLYKHAIEGYNGKQGVMPAKGGRVDLSDDLVKAAVDYMVAKAQ